MYPAKDTNHIVVGIVNRRLNTANSGGRAIYRTVEKRSAGEASTKQEAFVPSDERAALAQSNDELDAEVGADLPSDLNSLPDAIPSD